MKNQAGNINIEIPENNILEIFNALKPPDDPIAPALFVATDMSIWKRAKIGSYIVEITQDNKCYRLLDPKYYAWLRHKMTLAKKAFDSGRIKEESYNKLRLRFNAVHDWAMDHLSHDDLQRAVNCLDPKTYPPPSPEPMYVARDRKQPRPQVPALFPKRSSYQDHLKFK